MTKTFTVVAIAVTTSLLPAGVHGHAYKATLVAAGGAGTKTWTLSFGALPVGLTFSPTGVISWTPTTAGAWTFTVKVIDTASPPSTATKRSRSRSLDEVNGVSPTLSTGQACPAADTLASECDAGRRR